MVSAICPDCHILLVEAKSASFANLGTAVNQAARTAGAVAIATATAASDAADTTYGSYYNHPGIAITASSGDNGYGGSYPASSHYVTAVGGTSLTRSGNTRGWTETAWSGAGTGCSTLQHRAGRGSELRHRLRQAREADVSAVADPQHRRRGLRLDAYQGFVGWLVFGGTSVSAPIIGCVYALAGNTSGYDNNYPTPLPSLFDVTSGCNGTCPTTQWCNARAGWDGPTGLGTPNGVGALLTHTR